MKPTPCFSRNLICRYSRRPYRLETTALFRFGPKISPRNRRRHPSTDWNASSAKDSLQFHGEFVCSRLALQYSCNVDSHLRRPLNLPLQLNEGEPNWLRRSRVRNEAQQRPTHPAPFRVVPSDRCRVSPYLIHCIGARLSKEFGVLYVADHRDRKSVV